VKVEKTFSENKSGAILKSVTEVNFIICLADEVNN